MIASVFSPGGSCVAFFGAVLHEIDGEIRAYLQGSAVIEFQRWTTWERSEWSGELLLRSGYRHAICVEDPKQADSVTKLLRDGDLAQWRELEAARVEDRHVRSVR